MSRGFCDNTRNRYDDSNEVSDQGAWNNQVIASVPKQLIELGSDGGCTCSGQRAMAEKKMAILGLLWLRASIPLGGGIKSIVTTLSIIKSYAK